MESVHWKFSRRCGINDTTLKETLEENPDSLNGQIIFEKDVKYNMSLESTVVYALPEKLKLLTNYGYKVITVSSLLTLSQFMDVDPASDVYAAIMFLISKGKPLYRDNTFREITPAKQKNLAPVKPSRRF